MIRNIQYGFLMIFLLSYSFTGSAKPAVSPSPVVDSIPDYIIIHKLPDSLSSSASLPPSPGTILHVEHSYASSIDRMRLRITEAFPEKMPVVSLPPINSSSEAMPNAFKGEYGLHKISP